MEASHVDWEESGIKVLSFIGVQLGALVDVRTDFDFILSRNLWILLTFSKIILLHHCTNVELLYSSSTIAPAFGLSLCGISSVFTFTFERWVLFHFLFALSFISFSILCVGEIPACREQRISFFKVAFLIVDDRADFDCYPEVDKIFGKRGGNHKPSF